MSMNHYDMESNSRLEHLIEFKVVYGESIHTVEKCLEKYFPDMSVAGKQEEAWCGGKGQIQGRPRDGP